MPSTLAPDRLGVSSRRVPSRGARPPGKGEVTLSQELRTAGLLRPHVLVGSGGHTSGCVLVVSPVTTDTSVVSCHRPGSQGALLLPSPLRTARKPFGLCRSSLSQGPSRDPVGVDAPPARYWSGADGRDTPETAPAASCRHLLCLPSQLFRRSRAETPEGSQPAFAWDDLAGGLNPYPLDYRATFASSLILYPPSHRQPPCGGPTPRGGRRAYHVPRMNHGWFRFCLSAGGRNGDGRGWENPLRLATYLLVQASQRLWLAGSHDVYQQFT